MTFTVITLKQQYKTATFAVAFVCAGLAAFFSYQSAYAGVLTQKSDTLSTPKPSTSSNHTIVFTTASIVPASGKIVIIPQATYFTIPAGLDFNDVDVTVDGSAKTLASTAGAGAGSAWGVSVTTGSSGSISITLNDTDTISGNITVQVKIGTNATTGITGDTQITNPSSIGSYTIALATKDSSNAEIDAGNLAVAIVETVGIGGTVGATPTPTPTPTSGGGGGGGGGGYTPPTLTPTPTTAPPSASPTSTTTPTSGEEQGCNKIPADLNCNTKVDSVDFSIMMYYWQQKGAGLKGDVNKDGVVNLIDFSLLLYWWTG